MPTPPTGADVLIDRIMVRLVGHLKQGQDLPVRQVLREELTQVPVLAGSVGLIVKHLRAVAK